MAGALAQRETESRSAETALREHSERTEALVRVAGRLNRQLDLKSVLSTICAETGSAFGGQYAAVGLYDSQSDSFQSSSECGLPDEIRTAVAPLKRADVTARTAAEGVFEVGVADAACDFPDAEHYRNAGISHVAGAVMMHEGQLVGCLFVFASQELTVNELAMLRGLADQAAMAISNARLYAALELEQQQRAGLLEKVITAQEEERKRIARELHDDTSQGLTASVLSLEAAELALSTGGRRVGEHLATGKRILQHVLDSTQRLMRDLRPSLLDDLGLAPAIVSYAEERLKRQGIEFRVVQHGDERRLPAVAETALFRIAQEAITNAVRHSGATLVELTLEVGDDQVRLVVQDNGAGFDLAAAVSSGVTGRGLGLRGMQERAAILGGECTIESASGKGTVVSVRAPVGMGEGRHV
jgi:signal transduction histidine kinase